MFGGVHGTPHPSSPQKERREQVIGGCRGMEPACGCTMFQAETQGQLPHVGLSGTMEQKEKQSYTWAGGSSAVEFS